MNKKILVGVVILIFIVIVCVFWFAFFYGEKEDTLQLVPKEKISDIPGNNQKAAVGWSVNSDYKSAISEAVGNARKKLGDKQPNFAHVIYISETDHDLIINEVRNQLPGVKIYGYTSNSIITNDKIIENVSFAMGILLVASDDITFGMSEINQDAYGKPEDVGRTAILNAIADAGKTPAVKPQMVFYMGTTMRGKENQIMDGIAEIIGKDVPVIGGNAKDFGPKFQNNWRQFTDKQTYTNGLILVAVYTDKKVGWGFEATFQLTDKKGIVTKSDGFRIAEIDNKPALDVYDEWVGGEFYRRLDAGEFNSEEEKVDFALVKKFTLLNPIAKIVRGEEGQMGQFATSPIPDAQDISDKTITVYAQVSAGDEISLYRGTWQTAMNRVESIPNEALLRAGLKKGEGVFAIMAFCNGLKTILPPEEFQKVSAITDDVLGIPFLGAITAGEQGPIPGIGNVNANLIESVAVIGK